MFIVDDKIISTELFTAKFICDLSKCKGACCWEGDFGAPVTKEEETIMNDIMPVIRPNLSQASQRIIDAKGITHFDAFVKGQVTPLHPDGACVYLVKDELGIARCAFEKAWEEGRTSFKKPISCHLYPVRISENKATDFEALNYDEWSICKAACSLGEAQKMPVFRFVREAIIRHYGKDFYDQLEDIYATYFT